jgi:hypothetical protein
MRGSTKQQISGFAKGCVPFVVFAFLAWLIDLMAEAIFNAEAEMCGERVDCPTTSQVDCPTTSQYVGVLIILALVGAVAVAGVIAWALKFNERRRNGK